MELHLLLSDSTHLQSIARSAASQIISEEVLASCSGGPRGNEQLRVYCFLFICLSFSNL
jgi:nucleolar MIF4G domain-containing protein 1